MKFGTQSNLDILILMKCRNIKICKVSEKYKYTYINVNMKVL